MSKTTLIFFWIIWLVDVGVALFGYREFINGVFGRYAAPSAKYIMLWVTLFAAMLLILGTSWFLKNQGKSGTALGVAAIPLILALPYILFLVAMIIGGRSTNWR